MLTGNSYLQSGRCCLRSAVAVQLLKKAKKEREKKKAAEEKKKQQGLKENEEVVEDEEEEPEVPIEGVEWTSRGIPDFMKTEEHERRTRMAGKSEAGSLSASARSRMPSLDQFLDGMDSETKSYPLRGLVEITFDMNFPLSAVELIVEKVRNCAVCSMKGWVRYGTSLAFMLRARCR